MKLRLPCFLSVNSRNLVKIQQIPRNKLTHIPGINSRCRVATMHVSRFQPTVEGRGAGIKLRSVATVYAETTSCLNNRSLTRRGVFCVRSRGLKRPG